MARRVSFSGQNLSISEAALHHNDTDRALRLFFSPASPFYVIRFAGYKPVEVREGLVARLAELDRNTTMSLLTAVEAAFRIDYIQRCNHKKKDDVSRQFRELYKKKYTHASLGDDILEIWKNNMTGNTKLIGDLRGALKFRDWMAHGRYLKLKLGKKYDYLSVYPLAQQALSSFPLMAHDGSLRRHARALWADAQTHL